MNRRINKSHLVFFICLLNCVLFLSSCLPNGERPGEEIPGSDGSRPILPSPPPISPAVGIISNQRTQAEQAVQKLKRDYSTGNITTSQYEEGRKYYNQAQAAFNAWIDEIDAALVDRSPIDSDNRKEALSAAVNSSETFVKYVNSGYPEEILTPYSFDLGKLEPFLDAAKKIWDAYWNENSVQRQEMRKIITGMKWKNFDDILV
jgi:hypothetical protein